MDWSIASRPIAGEVVSGDLHLVKPFDHGVLVAVVDGVGHGDEATAAAQSAVAILESHSNESVISLVRRCHEALTESRGVVMTVASLNALENTITWLGVGNVEGRVLRADRSATHPAESVLLRGGLVGYQLPALQASVIPVTAGDVLILATDGIRDTFADNLGMSEAPEHMASHILERHFKGTDDALVLVARYLGMHHE
jgi:negative regulator of sigma-B (phosphoserine phosphatase)